MRESFNITYLVHDQSYADEVLYKNFGSPCAAVALMKVSFDWAEPASVWPVDGPDLTALDRKKIPWDRRMRNTSEEVLSSALA
jgi:hypothetical protein